MNGGRPRDGGWRRLRSRERRAALERLLDREWAYVPITACLREAPAVLPGRGFSVFVTRRGAAVADVVLLARDGLLLPAFDDRGRRPDARPGAALRAMIAAPAALHSSMGPTADVRRVELLLGLRPRVCVDHVLMTLDRGDLRGGRAGPVGVAVRRATVRDTARMLALREAYEREEVILDPSRFDRRACQRRLRRSLRGGLVYVAERRGRPVATAATNARGVRVDQIGGVFTARRHRRAGLGTAVMAALLRDLFRDRQQACLFVKTGNAAALRLYERLGFSARGGYRISYYR